MRSHTIFQRGSGVWIASTSLPHHDLRPHHLNSLATVDSKQHGAPPLSRWMWAHHHHAQRRKVQRGEGTRGDPKSGRPMRCVARTRHGESRVSFSLFLSHTQPLTIYNLPPSLTHWRQLTETQEAPRRRRQPNAGLGSPMTTRVAKRWHG